MRRDDTGAVARLFVVLVVDRFHHRVRDVQRGQVHQFKRAELEAGLVFQYAVNGGEIGNAFTHDAQRFGAVTTPGVVDDKARRVLRLHGGVTHFTGVLR